MTVAEFKNKWHRFRGKETSGYVEHFNDLCRLLGQQTPNEADPSGRDFFCFQKRVRKSAELFDAEAPDGEPDERGFADVWKKDCFGWEYKGKKKNLDEAFRQLQRYREDLQNPPLLIVCDFDRYIIRTNFNGTVQETIEFTNAEIDNPQNWNALRACFENPDFLKPQQTTAQVTEKLAAQIAKVAKSLQERESVELSNVKTRKEVTVAKNKNLSIARFLNRLVFCMFAEDTGLLPKDLFTEILKASLYDPKHFVETTEDLFKKMRKGGRFGNHVIRHFNGHLFDDFSVFELTENEIQDLAEAAEAQWQFVQPGIMGTLFERALDFEEGGKLRAQLGAHYTSETDIKTLVEPVLMHPFRREWAQIKGELAAAYEKGKGTPAQRDRLSKFQKKLSSVTVLDPACGSGNFLYVSLQLLLALEKEVVSFAAQLGFKLTPQVGVQQLRAIEINPYAFELAQVSVQIGYLQWRRDNGFDNDRTPVLQNLDGFENKDALLEQRFKRKKSLKQARKKEHAAASGAEIFHIETHWPEADVIVSNPPFLGGKLIRRELGDAYVDAMFENFGERVPPESDLCCYWFEKARQQIENKKAGRAGLLATQGIRGGANREVLKRIKETGDIFFAESDRDWILAGANVHVSMVGFDSGDETTRILDGQTVKEISPQLDTESKAHKAKILESNTGISFMGITPAGAFDVAHEIALEWLNAPNPSGKPNSDVLRPYFNGNDLTKRAREAWTIDFGVDMEIEKAASYEQPFGYLAKNVKPVREKNRREAYARNWWIYAESRPAMREAFSQHSRFLATCMVAKHRMFVWLDIVSLPANVVIAFGRSDDFFLGLLQSKFHDVWALKQGTRLETRPRYTPTTCFETFPFPRATPAQETAIAAAAKELNQLREGWLNPPEWTEIRTLEFPGTPGGVWARYIDPATIREVTLPGQDNIPEKERQKIQVGTVVYPRREPKDAKCAADLKKRTLTNLYNARPPWLDNAHKALDAAVAAAYGWPADLTDEQILEKLLALNLERAAEEAAKPLDEYLERQELEAAGKKKAARVTREKHAEELI